MIVKGFFNESCNICRAEINHYKKINKSIDWIDVISNKSTLKDTKLSSKELIRRVHILKNNKLHKSLDAFLIIWSEIPRYKFLSRIINHIKKIISSNFDNNEFYKVYNYEIYLENYYNSFKDWVKRNNITDVGIPYVTKGNWNKIYKKLISDNP